MKAKSAKRSQAKGGKAPGKAPRGAAHPRASGTICVSLDPEYVAILDRLAGKTGSRSAALRAVLDEHVRAERLRELEAAYGAYFAAPSAAAGERALTEAMGSAARWPSDRGEEAAQGRGDQGHPAG